ncbi:hypothetical protein Pmani_011886 [Petrolisthes manimaculis]|uniref:Queuine tRNA-ribosyltransferase accessory subunit 2 n=1 Tax=Petrolisthes manimaculis TaxID=1843537 RepID=A0AAE1UF71_9EUCA|nr:hypothetical protein Pmani_011886 [Petrolisthes manimaculis]
MKFAVERISKGGGRLGKLSNLRSQPDVIHATPMTLVATVGGSAPHLTQDVFNLVAKKDAPLCVSAQHYCKHVEILQAYKKGVASFAALKGHSVCVTVQDAAQVTPSGYNDKQGISTWTHGGRQVLTPQTYMNVVEVMQPDWYEVLCDADTPPDASKKRLSKSAAMSKSYLTQCLKLHKDSNCLQGAGVLIPLLGGHSNAERVRWSKWVADNAQDGIEAAGYSLLGLHTNGPKVEKIDAKAVCELVETSLGSLSQSLPRQASGAWNPLTVVRLVMAGVDIFDSTFPYLVTERCGALTFLHWLTRDPSIDNLQHQNKRLRGDSEKNQNQDEEETWNEKEKESKSEELESTEGKENQCDEEVNVKSSYEICLKDKRYAEVQEPLVSGCECYTCQNFTIAYIHHLTMVKELLAPVLLSIHNLHHWFGFFSSIRTAVGSDQLADLQRLLQTSAA